MSKLASYRKALVALVGAVAYMISLGLLHGTALTVASAVVGLATAAGVYAAPNTTTVKLAKDAGEGEMVMVLIVATFLLVLGLAFGVLPK